MSDNSINPEIEWKLELYNCDGEKKFLKERKNL